MLSLARQHSSAFLFAASELGVSATRVLGHKVAAFSTEAAGKGCAREIERPDLAVPWVHGKSVYRKLLRAAKHYPSIKRDGIYRDIRIDFREHKDVRDERKLLQYRSQAVSGLAGLEQYTKVKDDTSNNWQVGPVNHPDINDPNAKGTRR